MTYISSPTFDISFCTRLHNRKFAMPLSVCLHTSYTRFKVRALIILQHGGFYIECLRERSFFVAWQWILLYVLAAGWTGCVLPSLALDKLRRFLLFQSGYFLPLTWLSRNLVWKSCLLKFPEELKLCVTTPIHFLRCRLPGTLNCHSTSAVFLYFFFFSKKKQSVRPSAWDLMRRQRNRCQKSEMTLVNSDDTSSRLWGSVSVIDS